MRQDAELPPDLAGAALQGQRLEPQHTPEIRPLPLPRERQEARKVQQNQLCLADILMEHVHDRKLELPVAVTGNSSLRSCPSA